MRLTASRPFVRNDDEFLQLCLTSRTSGIPASQRLNVRDGIAAWALDDAVSLRLLHWDNEVKRNDARIMANAIWGGDSGESDDYEGEAIDTDGAEVW